ncbi:tail fiber domain-containing protein, partial [Escherichia coli]|uniref:tail fiber domain-containing protein n=1 Tax=Escherichia coli TaxID=562 RepID=UPI003CFB5116
IKDTNGRVKFLTGVGKDASQSTEIASYGGGIVFNHNGSRLLASWIQGANYMLQFGGKAIFKWQDVAKRFEFRTENDGGWTNAAAGSFQNSSSLVWKTDIKNYEESGLDLIMNTDVMTYRYKSDVENATEGEAPTRLGVISEYAPKAITNDEGSAVDLYAMISVAWKAIQELNEKINELKAENVLLKGRLDGLNN